MYSFSKGFFFQELYDENIFFLEKKKWTSYFKYQRKRTWNKFLRYGINEELNDFVIEKDSPDTDCNVVFGSYT